MEPTTEQGIKIGFLQKCAEMGLTVDETNEYIKIIIDRLKTHMNTKEAGVGTAALTLLNGLPYLGALGVGGLLAAPVLAGTATGYGAAKITKTDKKDLVGDIKHDEIVSEYERLADEAKRRALLKRIQAQTGRRIIPLSPSLG